jgi:hypothetical protein
MAVLRLGKLLFVSPLLTFFAEGTSPRGHEFQKNAQDSRKKTGPNDDVVTQPLFSTCVASITESPG